jgi:hypothetical protein
MSGDYSRKRFNPENHYQGVLRQQGRVDLDADWNEYIDLQDRRWRAETIDVIGRCGVPSETPDGFKIAVAAGELTVGQGRIYVDGFLAENHGANVLLNATLEEKYGTAPLPVNDQPYGAGPVAIPTQGRSLVYLDVWRREVTHLQAPDLIEPAVNVDTTTRDQTAWQVKILGNIAVGVTCETPLTDIPNWPAANLPSTARLTTTTVAVTTEPDPCLVPPSGGYRGLENHLYRVEVHDVTGTGAVRVKWSRENAYVASQIVQILTGRTGIKVESLGRDDVLRFKTGDWVEITSDSREFAGLAGFMRKVTVDDTNQTLTFGNALPLADFPEGPADADDHPRVIRWDQSGSVRKPDGSELVNLDFTTDGLIELSAANLSFVLEHGIQATLSILAGGTAHAGDYWCFAARTADADIERLNAAPPLGIHHHFCKLAIIDADGSIDDCRPVFSPLTELKPGCCTVVVRPGEDIQVAIDSLPDEGGCVCLRVGEHKIQELLRIEKSNVALHGETLGARVVRNNGAALLQIGHPNSLLLENVTVSGIHFEFENKGVQVPGLPALLAIDRCNNTKIEGCVIRAQEIGNLAGVLIGRSADTQVSQCQIENVRYGIWVASDSTRLYASGNVLDSAVNNKSDGGIVGIFLAEAFGPSDVEENRITGFIFGIALNQGLFTGTPLSLASGSAIAGNRILRLNVQTVVSDTKAFAIDVAANDCAIRNNSVIYAADAYGGILASGANVRVEGNTVRSLAKEVSANPSIGILVERRGPQGSLGSVGGAIAGNSILGPQDGVWAIGNDSAEVCGNRIESDAGEARFAIGLLTSSRVRAHGNRITNVAFPIAANQGTANEIADNTLLRGGSGVTVFNQTSLEFSQNRVEDMRNYGLIGLQSFAKFVLSENRFLSCGYQQAPAIGIGVSQHFGELHIESCEVMNTGVSPDNSTISAVAWGIFADYVLEARVQSNNVTYSNAALMDANQEHRALWLRGSLEQVVNLGGGQLVIGFSAQILDNKFLGPGRSALVETAQQIINDNFIRRFERLFFNNNFCWHVSVAAQGTATVSLFGRSAIVMGNHIKTNALIPSVDFHGMRDGVYMGNIAQTNPVNFAGIPSPISGFNKP